MAHHGKHNRQKNFPNRRTQRAAEATARNAKWASLSFDEQLAVLKTRPGACLRQHTVILDKIKQNASNAQPRATQKQSSTVGK